jgi:serine O-acetyltransferase
LTRVPILRKASPRQAFLRELRGRQPGFREAILADAEITARQRGERDRFHSKLDAAAQILRLCWASDAFAAQVLYRMRVALQRRGVPVLPQLLHRLSMMIAQVSIGDPVIVHPGAYVIHGQVVLDGIVEVGSGAVLGPWITIGLKAGNVQGATIGADVHVGTGAKIVGPVRIGAGARIGANAVVVADVAAGATVTGVPARPIGA